MEGKHARTRARKDDKRMDNFGYCEIWPEEMKELSRRNYRAACHVRCLEAALDRIAPTDFEALMTELEAARQELFNTASGFRQMKLQWTGKSIIDQMSNGTVG